MNREARLDWMRDLLEHMLDCHNVLQWSQDKTAEHYLTDKLLGDLQVCQELCESLRSEPTSALPV